MSRQHGPPRGCAKQSASAGVRALALPFFITCTNDVDRCIHRITGASLPRTQTHMHSLINFLLLCFIIYIRKYLILYMYFFILSVGVFLSQIKRLYILYRAFLTFIIFYVCKSKKLHIHCKNKIKEASLHIYKLHLYFSSHKRQHSPCMVIHRIKESTNPVAL